MDVKQSGRARRRRAVPADLGLLPGLIGYQVRLAQRAIFADFAATVGAEGISPGLFGVLVIIEANPGLNQRRLAEAAHLDRSSLVPVIDKLEARGLVERRAADLRSNGVFLTAAGAALLRKLKRKVQQHEQRVGRNLSVREQRELVRLLGRILPDRR
ncbi:MAG TPA: MarR family transcriptional regulator [Burkholderiales bacterium]|nr:MarR family transcriptional regulator [Burkholderiales bacterium]